jgi:hypothetical protein
MIAFVRRDTAGVPVEHNVAAYRWPTKINTNTLAVGSGNNCLCDAGNFIRLIDECDISVLIQRSHRYVL